VLVFDVTNEFKLIKTFKTKAAVRSLCQFDSNLLVCGENEGYIDIIFYPTLELTVGRRFEKIGHIYQIQPTSIKNEMVVCSYTGVHFVKIFIDKITGAMTLVLSETCYITE